MLTADAFVADVFAEFGIIDTPVQSESLDVISWIETKFFIPERMNTDNPAMQLDAYQKAVITEAHRLKPDGKFVYDVILWSDIKKSAKSSIAAAIILYRALHTTWGSMKIVANDLKQADSRVFYYIRRALELNPELTARASIRNYKITIDNHTIIEAVPVDPKGEAGGNDDLIEFTELHAADSKAAQSMWSEMTISPTKHGYSQRWIDTYAGYSGESPILEQLYELGVKQGQQLTLPAAPIDLEVFANGSLLVLWNTQPRLIWQTPGYYASEAMVLTPPEFQRMHRNQWVASENVFVPGEWWDACRGEVPELLHNEPLVISADAGVTNDCFFVVAGFRRAAKVHVFRARVWKPPKGGAIDFSGPEQFIRELASQFNVIECAYDPYQLHDMATRLTRDGVCYMRSFSQGQDRLIADKLLYDTIRDRNIIHDGNADLSEHVKNANAKTEGEKLRIVKRVEHLKIDGCVSTSMLNYELQRLSVG
jgi:phage terminase large subunit-like protein